MSNDKTVPNTTDDNQVIERISEGSKQFYSAGATFSTLTCATIVLIVWNTMGKLATMFQSNLCGLVISFAPVFAYALIIPEPKGYPNAGKLRITIAESIFGIVNTFIVFSTAIGLASVTSLFPHCERPVTFSLLFQNLFGFIIARRATY